MAAPFISRPQQQSTSEPQLLNGWKEIANYLGKGVRTVQRYERESRLPVHRPAARLRSSVVVSRRELDEWISRGATSAKLKAPTNSEPLVGLRSEILELQRLRAERRELLEELRAQRSALELNTQRIREALSTPGIVKTERHRIIAAEQKVRARAMGESARMMTDQAVEMRKAPQRRLIVSC